MLLSNFEINFRLFFILAEDRFSKLNNLLSIIISLPNKLEILNILNF